MSVAIRGKINVRKALELAHSMEAAMKSAKEIQGTSASQKEEKTVQPPPTEQVHQLQSGENCKGREPCYRCGGINHAPSQCRFIGKHCFNCGKLGHTARMCRSKKPNSAQQQNARNPVRVVQMESPEYDSEEQHFNDEYSLNQVTTAAEERLPQKPLEVNVLIDGKE
jgi:hypothetical protein